MLADFETHLRTQGRSPHTIRSYLSDLRQFARWFRQTNGEDLLPERVTAIDVREYRQYMLNVQRLKASTINRRLAALSVYLEWGKASGRILDNPASDVRAAGLLYQPGMDEKHLFGGQVLHRASSSSAGRYCSMNSVT